MKTTGDESVAVTQAVIPDICQNLSFLFKNETFEMSLGHQFLTHLDQVQAITWGGRGGAGCHVNLGVNLRFSKAGVQKPNAATDVCDQDNVDCELKGSHFTNVVVKAVL